jgi:protein involved in polysaccharide export with SLBB domain
LSTNDWKRVAALISMLLGSSLAMRGQEPSLAEARTNSPVDNPVPSQQVMSDLLKDNLDRVAASATQLKVVLLGDAGLLVELKRWVAKEASDSGQVIAEEGLTDDALFERLADDVKFRAVATRLVQKYGYLKPNVNPGSELARQQDYVLRERARKLVQVEDEEDQRARSYQSAAARSASAAARCRSEDGEDCAVAGGELGSSQTPLRVPAGRDGQPAVPDQEIPRSNSSLLRAQGNPGSEFGNFSGDSAIDAASGEAVLPTSAKSSDDSSLPANLSAGRVDSPLFNPERPRAGTGGLPDVDSFTAGAATAGDSPDAANNLVGSHRSAGSRLARGKDPVPEMVHRPTPYGGIPSLYDLYVQAPSQDLNPQRFGAQVFRDGMHDSRAVPMDLPVGPDYVVGPGDVLSIDLWGGVSFRLNRTVDRQGRVTLPEAGPLEVSGRTLGDVQQLVQRTLAPQYHDTSAEVSVSRLRTVRVYVVGEVSEPGAYDISSLSTPLNALVAAGGVTPRGSLRLLQHYHGRQLLETVDAYDLLLHGVTPDAKKLENGDTLMVPPLGPQVTVTGMVRRPAIYELQGEKNLADALDLAGGILPAATLKHVEVQRLEAHEKRTMLSLDLSADGGGDAQLQVFHIKDGDQIHIFPIAPYNEETIYLQGHVLRPGKYSYHRGIKFSDVVASYKDLLPEPAAHYGEIIRLSPPDFRPTVVSFDLASALQDPSLAPALQPLDTIRIFGRYDFEPPPVVSVNGEVRRPGTYETNGQASLRDAIFLAGGLTASASTDTAQLFRINPDGSSRIFSVNLRGALGGDPAENLLLQPRDRLLIHRNTFSVDSSTVEITGEVAKPGRYPYTGNMRAEDLIRAAGGLKRSADQDAADLTRYAIPGEPAEHVRVSLTSLINGNPTEDVPLRPGDVLAVGQIPGWKDIGASIKVSGEVLHPSTLGIQSGERLSSILERAGGFTSSAYPYGALLVRKEVREVEAKAQTDLILRLRAQRAQLATLPESDQNQKNAKQTAISQADATLTELETRTPAGRVVVHIQGDIAK